MKGRRASTNSTCSPYRPAPIAPPIHQIVRWWRSISTTRRSRYRAKRLTYAPGPGGEHYLDIEGEGRNPTRAHVLRLGARHSLDAKAVTAMVEEVRAAVARWTAFADGAGVTKASAKEISAAHARVWAAFDV